MRSQNTTIQISGVFRRRPAWRRMLDAGNALGLAAMAVLAPMLWTLAGVALPAQAQQLTKLTYGTNWLAEAEHGGFYQAVADGTYTKYGLDVTIRPGGPTLNTAQLLALAPWISASGRTAATRSISSKAACRRSWSPASSRRTRKC